MASMLQSGLDITPIITHRYFIGDFREAFELMASGQSGKVILSWEEAAA
jgi:threonine 3-dehydrogenase